MELKDFAASVLFGTTLTAKLVEPGPEGFSDTSPAWSGPLPAEPGRPPELALQALGARRTRVAFPELRELEEKLTARGLVLHAFANHELLAMELMALALLRFPEAPPAFRAGLAQTIVEEQRHMTLYRRRMADFGVDFGVVPVSRFFWDAVAGTASPLAFVTQMALTLEQANLDFAAHYRDLFRRIGDGETADLMELVHREEIGHVKHGLVWFNRWREPELSEWEGYKKHLPAPLTPGRAKGLGFDLEARRAAGLSEEFIAELAVYNSSKGRPSVVFWFNPGCEDEVSAGRPGVVLNRAARDLQHDLCGLMLFLALDSDVVLVEERPTAGFLATLAAAGFNLPEIVADHEAARVLENRAVETFEPWGKSLTAARRAEELGLKWRRPLALPPDPAVFSKAWSAGLHGYGTVCRTLESANAAIDAGLGRELVVKASLGASGRHMHRVSCDGKTPAGATFQAWLAKVIARQGAVVVEPWLDKIIDLSVQIEVGATAPHVVGITRFLTDPRGRYLGHVLGRKLDDLPQPVVRAIHENSVYQELETVGTEVGAALARAGYTGPAGLDALLYRESDANPVALRKIVEVNPRYTMGRIALALDRQLHSATRAVWMHVPTRDAARMAADLRERYPLQMRGGKIDHGVLVTNDPAQARSVLTMIVAGQALTSLGPELGIG